MNCLRQLSWLQFGATMEDVGEDEADVWTGGEDVGEGAAQAKIALDAMIRIIEERMVPCNGLG
jgi:hypothetical protein